MRRVSRTARPEPVGHGSETAASMGDRLQAKLRRALLVRGLAPAFASAVALSAAWAYAWPYTVDDAFIVGRYARHLAAGRGYTFNAGEVTDGVTSPLWLALSALLALGGSDPVAGAKVLGACLASLSVALCVLHARRSTGGVFGAWACAALCVTSVPLCAWAIAGLETAAAMFAVTLLALEAIGPRPRGFVAGLAAALLPWLRPELFPSGLVLCAFLAVRQRRQGTIALVLALCGLASVVLFRAFLFGHFSPMTAAAKPSMLAHGAQYAWAFLRHPGTWGMALSCGAALAQRRVRNLVIALIVHLGAIVLAGGDWMPGGRLFAPLVPCAALASARVLAHVWAPGSRPRRGAVLGLLVLVLVGRSVSLTEELREMRHAGQVRAARVPALAALLATGGGPIALVDVGMLGYLLDRPMIDLAGLTEPRIAYAKGPHLDKRIDSAWLRQKAPAVILLHSREAPRVDTEGRLRWLVGFPVERRVSSWDWVILDYRVSSTFVYASDYHYVLLVPRRP